MSGGVFAGTRAWRRCAPGAGRQLPPSLPSTAGESADTRSAARVRLYPAHPFIGDRRLGDAAIDTIADWAGGDRLVGSIWTSAYGIDIPAGDAAWATSADYTLPKQVMLVGVVPHMHLLGRAVRVRAELPDGTSLVLVDIPRWNYSWQDEFYYREPFRLPAGTRIVTEGVFDNSAAKPVNPSRPPRRVTWGDGTLDEMLFCLLLVSAERTEDLVHVVLDNLRHDLAQPRR